MSEDTEKYGRKLSLSAYDKKHLQNLLKQAKLLEKQFDDAVKEAVRLGKASGFTDPDGEFTFENFPAIKERAEKLFQQFHDSIVATITNGNREEWLLSAAKNDALVDKFAAKYGERAKQWKDPNLTALQRFNERKERGMNLSDRVWKLSDQFKGELELALELGLGEGKSAADLSRDVRQYLREPNKLFRRVRNEKGQLRLSKAAKAYHPGQGVYRSSYKNALRLTATENNIAYRTADHERWQQLDFVIGIQIMLSNNHTCNGQPFFDICDTLQGMYPKTFKFVGWHPFCRCIAVPKLADEDEFIAQQQALIDGREFNTPFSGEVTELPSNFVNWVEENADKIEEAQSKPYFIKDNQAEVKNILEGNTSPRTATPDVPQDDIEEIQRRRKDSARELEERYDLSQAQKDKLNELHGRLEDALFFDPEEEFNEIFKELEAELETIRKTQNTTIKISAEQEAQRAELEKAWGIKRGKMMTTKEADVQSANPDWVANSPTSINCQTCVPAYMLRLQGYGVKATANTAGSLNEYLSKNTPKIAGGKVVYRHHAFEVWENADGSAATPTLLGDWAAGKGYKGALTKDKILAYYNDCTKKPGIYQLVLAWKGGGGHTTILQRMDDGTLKRIEPQKFNGSMMREIDWLASQMKSQHHGNYFGGIMRIDDKKLAKKYLSIFVKE